VRIEQFFSLCLINSHEHCKCNVETLEGKFAYVGFHSHAKTNTPNTSYS